MAELLIRLSRVDPYTKAKRVLYLRVGTSSLNVIIFIAMVVESIVFVHVLNVFYGSCPPPYIIGCNLDIFIKYMEVLGWITGTLYTILTLCLITTYIVLNKQLNQIFDKSTSREVFKSINMLFGVLVASYTLRTLFLYFQGHYRLVIHQKFVRLEGELILWPLFDFMCLIPILLMHRKNFGYKPAELEVKNISIVEGEPE